MLPIQAVYKLEADELDSERLGEGKYLLFWEAAEGGAGVLSQVLEKPEAFKKIADAASTFVILHNLKTVVFKLAMNACSLTAINLTMHS